MITLIVMKDHPNELIGLISTPDNIYELLIIIYNIVVGAIFYFPLM